MTIRNAVSCLLSILFSACVGASGATLTVGPAGTYLKPCQAFAAARAGDTILIDAAGDYTGDTCVVMPSNILIRGVNGRPKIDAGGKSAEGKAIWVLRGKNVTVENVEMFNCKVPDRNGAAIRAEGDNLAMRWVYFHHNEHGILTTSPGGDILIEFSEFAYNGIGNGYTHNLYIGFQQSVTMRFCYMHHAIGGNAIKSRAKATNLYYNRIMTEVSGTGSWEVDLSNGGIVRMVGNLIQQGQYSSNSNMLGFATEGGIPVNELRAAHNTFVSQKNYGGFFVVPQPSSSAISISGLILNNIFQGPATIGSAYVTTALTFRNNHMGDGWLADLGTYDYRLLTGSPGIDRGETPPDDLMPRWHYQHPVCGTPRTIVGQPDLGAYEAGAAAGAASGNCTVSWHDLHARITLPDDTVKVSGLVQARVTLNGVAPAGGSMVSLTSSRPDLVEVPATVTIPAGESTVSLPLNVDVGVSASDVVLTATLDAATESTSMKTAPVTVGLAALTLSTASAAAPASVTGRVSLNYPAPTGGVVVALTSSDPGYAAVPLSVMIPAGETVSPAFAVTTSVVNASTPVTITATYNGTAKTAALTLEAASLTLVALSPAAITGTIATTANFVRLSGVAPEPGAVVSLTSSNPAVAQVPDNVTVPAGSLESAKFAITTSLVSAPVTVTISATYGRVTKTATLTINPFSIWSLALSPPTMVGGQTAKGSRVTLNGAAPTGGLVVMLTSSNPGVASVPASVVVPGGATASDVFTIVTTPVQASTQVTITASYATSTKPAVLTVNPHTPYAVGLSPTSMAGGATSTANRVTLNAPAPDGGVVVQLSSSNSTVASVPATVLVPAGASASNTFTITTTAVPSPSAVIITATCGGASKTGNLSVTSNAPASVVLSPTSINGGINTTANVVKLGAAAPAGGAVVTLTSSNPSVASVPASVVVPAGATASAAFTITTSRVSIATPVTITATFNGLSKTATLNVAAYTPYSVDLSPKAATGGTTTTWNRVRFAVAAPAGGLTVTLASSNPGVASVPATVTVPAGTGLSAYFPIVTSSVGSPVTVTISATSGGVTKTAVLTVNP